MEASRLDKHLLHNLQRWCASKLNLRNRVEHAVVDDEHLFSVSVLIFCVWEQLPWLFLFCSSLKHFVIGQVFVFRHCYYYLIFWMQWTLSFSFTCFRKILYSGLITYIYIFLDIAITYIFIGLNYSILHVQEIFTVFWRNCYIIYS